MAAARTPEFAAGIAAGHERLAVREHLLARLRSAAAAGSGGCSLAKYSAIASRYGSGRILQQIVHRRIFAPAASEGEQLVVEISGRLAGEPREIDVAGAFALVAVTRRARLHARRHRVRRLTRRLGANGKSQDGKPQAKPGHYNLQPHAAPHYCANEGA